MKRNNINADKAPKAVGPYSHAVKVGEFLYTSGQIPLDPESGKVVSDAIDAQTRQVLENLKAVLEAGGTEMSKVIKTTIFLTDMGDFKAVNEIYAEYFGESLPARSTVQVAGLPLGVQVEIEAVAVA